jgi:signal transduction histidine kinase
MLTNKSDKKRLIDAFLILSFVLVFLTIRSVSDPRETIPIGRVLTESALLSFALSVYVISRRYSRILITFGFGLLALGIFTHIISEYFFTADESVMISEIMMLTSGFILLYSFMKLYREMRDLNGKLETMVTFLKILNSSLRHDILNSLTVILGYLEFYRENKDEFLLEKIEEKLRYIEKSLQNFKTAESLVGGENSQINLRELVEDVAQDFAGEAKISVRVEDVYVVGNSLLKSAIWNIFQNSIRHGGKSGIKIEVRSEDLGSHVDLIITDNGVGIPKSIREKVFEEGFSFGSTAGSGMGLFIVKKTVEMFDGKVFIDSNEPEGTKFIIRLKKAVVS